MMAQNLLFFTNKNDQSKNQNYDLSDQKELKEQESSGATLVWILIC